MTAALLLLAFCLLASTLGRAALARWAGALRAPTWGIVAWQSLSASAAVSLLLAGFAVAVPVLPASSQVAELASTTPFALTEHYQTPLGAWPGYVTLAASSTLLAALLVRVIVAGVRAVSLRRRQRAALGLVGQRHPDGYTVVDHAAPLVYCIPGRGSSRIVVSSSALSLLSDDELRLVLGHERHHLRARHDVALVAGQALATTFRWTPLLGPFLQEAVSRTAALAEMSADDSATAHPERRVLARALLAIAAGGRAAAAEPSSPITADRVRRLVTDAPRGLGRARSVGAALATAGLLAAPLGLAVAPAVEAATRDCCAVASTPLPSTTR